MAREKPPLQRAWPFHSLDLPVKMQLPCGMGAVEGGRQQKGGMVGLMQVVLR